MIKHSNKENCEQFLKITEEVKSDSKNLHPSAVNYKSEKSSNITTGIVKNSLVNNKFVK